MFKGGGRHLETDQEGLTHLEPDPVEKGINRGELRMAADVLRPRKILALLRGAIPAPGTHETFLPFDMRKISLAVKILFEVIESKNSIRFWPLKI